MRQVCHGSPGEPGPRSVRSPAMYVAVPREHAPGERRVALTPDAVGRLAPLGIEVLVESGAGAPAVDTAAALHEQADLVVRVGRIEPGEVSALREGCAFVGWLWPRTSPEL